jgi:hypothetical protein
MKAKHQFKYTYDESCENFSPVEVIFDIPSGEVTITQMLWNFECYLKACGFVFDGHLEIVSEDVCADTIDDTDYCCMGDTDYIKTDCIGKEHTPNHEIEKNKWVHGICNPPSPDWKATNSDHYDGVVSVNPKEYSKWLNKNKDVIKNS